jgi:hypothetical protein
LNFRLTIALALIAIALGASVFLAPAGGDPPAPPDSVLHVLSFDADEVASLELENHKGDRVLAEKQDSNWIVVSPEESLGDGRRLEPFVSRVASLVAKDSFQPDEPLSDFGLNPPVLTISIRMSDGVNHRLHIGAKTVDRRSTYGTTNGRTEVFLLPNLIADDAMLLITEPPYLAPAATATP